MQELAKDNATLARQITESQAWEKFVQAITSFINAAVSVYSAIDTTRNLGKATTAIDDQIDAHKTKLGELKREEYKTAKGLKQPPETFDKKTDLKNYNHNVDKMIKGDKDYKFQNPEIPKHEKALQDLEGNREYHISNRERSLSQISQMKQEAFKQTLQGVSGVINAYITLERAKMEELKALTDGVIQAFNKFSETASKARDDAKSSADRFFDYLLRIIESVNKTHSMGNRG